ncbi:putative quinol monooxygenase [Flavobacterium sp. LC2016-01]|uniref:putative quinol monooxygenase n=1 Tax=Flavobacterium sp. LC2016-01 TaxID=2675876 RepID=UPI0012BA76FC|nr:putative quinol monooxygenase [Flavobacterium sp. LC2016-01]MTH17731.1 antibiotic biosynthesis monooxygenase [Flavobacterium sp. LC2016-01]
MEKEVIVKWKIKESETAEILKLLPELAEKTKKEEGNIYYAIYQSEDNPNELILHERYVDQQAQEIHRNSKHYQSIVVDQIAPYLEERTVYVVKKLI